MNVILDSFLIVGGSVAASVLCVMFVRKKHHNESLIQHHEVAGYMLAVVSTLYAVLLGLIVVSAQTKYDQAKATAEEEANCCSDIGNFCRGLPADVAKSIRIPLKDYYSVVQKEDWEAIARGEIEQSIPEYQALWKSVTAYQPTGNREVSCYQSILSTMKSLSDSRRYRMFARKRALSPIVWVVLIAGGVMTVIFTLFFWVDSQNMQLVLTGFVTLFISLNLLLVQLFDNPYRKELLVKEGAFSFNPKVFVGAGKHTGSNQGTDEAAEDAKTQGADGATGEVKSQGPNEAARDAKMRNQPDPVLK